MYDRYTITAKKETLEKTFRVQIPEEYHPSYNAAPSHQLPVLTLQDPEEAQLFQWGFISALANNRSISPKLINLQGSIAFGRPMYRNALTERRCVILADGFYAWKQVSKKQKVPYFFYYSNRAPFGIAGIWEESEDLEGNVSRSFNMMTISASREITNHQEDMPAILKTEEVTAWLDPNASMETLEKLIASIKGTGLNMHPVSPQLHNPDINDDRLIKPSPPSDQFGNYTLFS